ncbi:prepilin-type N-terminal cleavage/methylation domain-containing protein [Serratia entomophila]|uniref:prepilin-type N-terminal cleavage/methylation domain-containing protein n=1 Tax=Serratia entomophila TaxID=42906 RepID=UPI002916C063|nr:prepilin-type N-terminal cleavage/methylation domain-containing protein [Serratia entomophila]
MKRAGGFTLLEIMLVLLLLGIASSLIMLRFPAPGGAAGAAGRTVGLAAVRGGGTGRA